MQRPIGQHGFTLVELLTVIAVISVLVGVLYTSMGGVDAAALKTTGNTIVDSVAMARQVAISQDAYTAVVVKTTGPNAYSSYCLMVLKRDSVTGNFVDSKWVLLKPWSSLSHGVVFDPRTTNNFLAATDSLMGAQADVSYLGQPIDLTNIGEAVFHVFAPDGTMQEVQPFHLRLVRGTWNSSAGNIAYTSSQTAGTSVDYYDIVFLPDTGQTKVQTP